MEIINAILTKNRCYTAGQKITVKGLILHSVGTPQPKASVFVNKWNSTTASACVHAFIDGLTGAVYQTLPWNHRGWHCGKGKNGSANDTHIGVEMCEPDCIKYTGGSSLTCSDVTMAKEIAERTYRSAVELFATRCKEFGLDPLADGVILGHAEAHKRGIASNHGDPEHLWKGLGLGYTMDTFRNAVKQAMEGTKTAESTNSAPTAENTANQAIKALSGKVKVIYTGDDGLNVRTAPCYGDQYIDHAVKAGTFTVVGISEDGKWYKLKSGLYITTGTSYVKFTATESTEQASTTVPYKVRAKKAVAIRRGAGANYAQFSATGVGVFTIVQEKNGYGLLKSYAKAENGWICLSDVEKV